MHVDQTLATVLTINNNNSCTAILFSLLMACGISRRVNSSNGLGVSCGVSAQTLGPNGLQDEREIKQQRSDANAAGM